MKRILIVGTGLVGASVGLALKAAGFTGEVLGWDASAAELETAVQLGAVDVALANHDAVLAVRADVTLLATPVLAIMDWIQRLSPVLGEGLLVTDVGSTKREIAALSANLYNGPGQARFLPGHPMAGKESGGAARAEATLFREATWLFTPSHPVSTEIELQWRALVSGFGARIRDIDPERHDLVCAWVSHLPQMVSTAMSALLQETFADDAEGSAAVQAIGGRGLREMTRLGASPYSMWRDVALTNTGNIAATLLALELRLQHMRENLRTPELRDEFSRANKLR
jgi:prephenate dehydrogenase